MSNNKLAKTIVDASNTKVDVLQVFISTFAIFGIGLFWIDFSEKVFKTVFRLAAAPFSWPSDEEKEEEE